MMTLYTYIHKECPVEIWGLTPSQRGERVLNAAGTCQMIRDLDLLGENDEVLILRADYLFDDRLINHLAATPNMVLQLGKSQQGVVVAAHVTVGLARQAIDVIDEAAAADSLPGVQIETPDTLSISFQRQIRKFDPPFVVPVTAGKSQELERRLFDWSYKGVTDLVTKWVWPMPARWVVKLCVRRGIRPNHVTLTGLMLVIAAGFLFAYGHYGWGLLAGWLMTFLDTVDGKLARVTVTSSRFGHYFDHIIDLVHPPIWYVLWGMGLATAHPVDWGFSIGRVYVVILFWYVAGRLCEGFFKWCLGRFGIFCWRPLDSYFRLITARRNPNMILLTVSLIMGRPDIGFLAVAAWTVLTSVFLLGRLGWGAYERVRTGPLRSWLMDVNPSMRNKSLAVRWFTRLTVL